VNVIAVIPAASYPVMNTELSTKAMTTTMMLSSLTTTFIAYTTKLPFDSCHSFMSSSLKKGNLGGISNADNTCQALAENAGLVMEGQVFKAMLSTEDYEPRFESANCLGSYYHVGDGAHITTNLTDLFSGNIDNPIKRDEEGFEVLSSNVLTGTNAEGSVSASNAYQYWSYGSSGRAGHYGKLMQQIQNGLHMK
jgi:hypothetical protein